VVIYFGRQPKLLQGVFVGGEPDKRQEGHLLACSTLQQNLAAAEKLNVKPSGTLCVPQCRAVARLAAAPEFTKAGVSAGYGRG